MAKALILLFPCARSSSEDLTFDIEEVELATLRIGIVVVHVSSGFCYMKNLGLPALWGVHISYLGPSIGYL